MPYVEEAHLQIFHDAASLRAGGGVTVPVLVHDAGVIGQSSDILRWVDSQSDEVSPLYPRFAARMYSSERSRIGA